MSRSRSLPGLSRGLALLLALAACGGGGSGRPPSEAVIRTLAYVVTECSDTKGTSSATQELRILRGDGPAVTVLRLPTFASTGHLCTFIASEFSTPFGWLFMPFGVFQRLGVSPDGAGVVFEVSGAFAAPRFPIDLPAAAEGIFFVRADGSGMRRLGDASREASFRSAGTLGGIPFGITFLNTDYGFSPDGELITFTDRGPGPTGEEAIQIVTLEVSTGTRRQLTHLPLSTPLTRNRPATSSPFFVDATRIGFFTTANPDGLNPDGHFIGFTMNPDGTHLKPAPLPIAVPGSEIVPTFAITGAAPNAATLPLTGPLPPGSPYPYLVPLRNEVFLLDGNNLLQLTNFHRNDTRGAIVSINGERVFFLAAADPLGTNPSENCQVFSIDRTAADLRQLTRFRDPEASQLPDPSCSIAACGCTYSRELHHGCPITFLWQDPVTETLVFFSACDPLGKNPNGSQIFAMRPDGSAPRQLTDTRGQYTASDGTRVVEVPGPLAYSSLIHALGGFNQ